MKEFKIGDYVYADNFVYGTIVEFEHDGAVVEFDTDGGGGSLWFALDQLEHVAKDARWSHLKRIPYVNYVAEAYATAINILAVEYLVKTYNRDEYSRRCRQLEKLDYDDLGILHVYLSINMHTSNLGAMITQGDYDRQRDILFDFLDNPEER